MPHKLLAFGIMGAFLFVGLSKADDHDKKTTLTVNEPLIIPGQQLQPGKYVMKLENSQSDRHIVQVFNEDQSKLLATIFAIPNRRTNLTSDTALMYYETPAGPALRSWFFPGDYDGQEFAYPKATADRIIAANASAKVPVVDDSGNLVTSSSTEVSENRNANADTFAERTDPNAKSAASPAEPAPNAERTDPGARVAQNAPPPVVTPQPGPAETPRQDNTLLAQNQPAPNPVQPAAPANNGANNNKNANADQLPQTASPLGWVLSFGLISIAGAFLMRRLGTNS
jgi:hypothetical protein